MFFIEEREATKLVGLTSLYAQFDFNRFIVDVLTQLPNRYYDPKTREWEIPLTELKYLIETISKVTDIKITLMKETQSLSFSIPKDYQFKTNPYKHQLEAIEYGLNNNNWLLLDDMGLGKTLTVIYIAEILKHKGLLDKVIIICGVNGLKWTWLKEIETHSKLKGKILGSRYFKRDNRMYIGSIKDRIEDLKNLDDEDTFLITNIETLRDEEFVKTLLKVAPKTQMNLIAVDEVHKAKNPTSLQGAALLKLNKLNRKIGMSGTMILTSPLDSYVPLKFIEKVKANLSTFKRFYCVYGGFGDVQIVDYKNINHLKDHIGKVSLRRKKEEVLDLPPKSFKLEYVEMDSKQAEFYSNLKNGIIEELDMLEKSPVQSLAMALRLRQATAWPAMLQSDVKSSAKLDRLEELVEEITSQGDKVLIFSSFIDTLNEVENRFKKYKYVRCDGSIKDPIINANKEQFQTDKDTNVMIATWQKMGTGHTLTAASYVIFIDTPYTDAMFQQAADRAYRIGTTKNVTVITLITKNSCDEAIQEVLEKRNALSNFLIDGEIKSEKAYEFLANMLAR